MPSEYVAQHPGFGRFQVWRAQHSANDDERTRQTVDRMRFNIRKTFDTPEVTRAAVQAVEHLPRHASQWEVFDAVYHWIQRRVRFTPDPPQDELLIEPDLLLSLNQAAGDCDDFTQLAGAMLGRLGYPSRIKTVKADRRDPSRWSHVYLEACGPAGCAPFDASHGNAVGWEAPEHYGMARWEGFNVTVPDYGLGFDWTPVISTGLKVGEQIGGAFATRISAPPGTFIQTPEGGVLSRGAPQSTPIIPSLQVGGAQEILPWVLIVGALVAGLAVLKR